MYIITGNMVGPFTGKVYWKRGSNSLPKWVNKFSVNCLFNSEKAAQATVNGVGSRHFRTQWVTEKGETVVVSDVEIMNYTGKTGSNQ